jgi:hypothetical protein
MTTERWSKKKKHDDNKRGRGGSGSDGMHLLSHTAICIFLGLFGKNNCPAA